MINNALFPSQYEQIVDLLRPAGAFLVGGAVRDALLKRPIHDLDFALPEGTVREARRVADQLGGGFFVMDPERQTCRVILKDEKGRRLVVDFTLFQGDSIEEDLASRDFTITSMALDIREDDKIIDLFQGVKDLKDGLIRVTSERSLEDDPLRCVRAVRLAAQLGFHLLPETREHIRRYQHLLEAISPERKRDEFFRLLTGPNQSAGILSLQILGVYPYIMPGEISTQQSRVLKNLEEIWSLFLRDHDQGRAASWKKGLLVHRLGRFRKNVRDYGGQELVPDRSLFQWSFIIPLFSGTPADEISLTSQQIRDQIHLSNQEAIFLESGIQAVQYWMKQFQEGGKDQPVEVYRFFRQFGRAGVAAILLCLGEALDEQREEKGQDRWVEHLDLARYFLEGYWERREDWVDPPALLDGNEIQVELGIPPGPAIGSLLEILREEQVRGGLNTREEGLKYLKGQFPRTEGSGP